MYLQNSFVILHKTFKVCPVWNTEYIRKYFWWVKIYSQCLRQLAGNTFLRLNKSLIKLPVHFNLAVFFIPIVVCTLHQRNWLLFNKPIVTQLWVKLDEIEACSENKQLLFFRAFLDPSRCLIQSCSQEFLFKDKKVLPTQKIATFEKCCKHEKWKVFGTYWNPEP